MTEPVAVSGWVLDTPRASPGGDSPLWQVLRRGTVLPVPLSVEDASRLLVYGELWSATGQPPFDLVRGHVRMIATERGWRIITDDPGPHPEIEVNPSPDETA